MGANQRLRHRRPCPLPQSALCVGSGRRSTSCASAGLGAEAARKATLTIKLRFELLGMASLLLHPRTTTQCRMMPLDLACQYRGKPSALYGHSAKAALVRCGAGPVKTLEREEHVGRPLSTVPMSSRAIASQLGNRSAGRTRSGAYSNRLA